MKYFQSIPTVKKYVTELYPSIGNIKKINYLKKNSINSTNFLIYTKYKKFVLHKLNDNIKSHRINQICKILKYCHQNGAKVPLPYQNYRKQFVDIKNNVYLTNYYSGSFFKGNILELKSLATEIARLHKILKKNPHSYNYKIDPKYKLIKNNEIIKIKKKISKKTKKDSTDKIFVQNYNLLINSIFECTENKSIIDKITKNKQLIHGDLHTRNIIFEKNKVKSILDFEQLRVGNTLEDIAFASFRFLYNNPSKPKKIKKQLEIFLKVYKEYNELNKVTPIQLGIIFQFEIFGLISYLLRAKYFYNSELWIHDFNKFIKLQKFLKKTISLL